MDLDLESLQRTLSNAAVPREQVPELATLVQVAAEDDSLRDRVEELVAGLTAQVGQLFERSSVFEPDDFVIGPGRGAVPLLALLRVREAVDEFWRGRGIPGKVRRGTAAEIGRQAAKTQRVKGWTGLDDAAWLETVFRGGFAQVGRLQYELIHDRVHDEYVLNTHIPEGGPLDPDVVADSMRRGRELMADAFPEYGPILVAVCDSWLLDPQLRDIVPGSNVSAFGRLWELENSGPGDGDALYFVFDFPRGSEDRLAEFLPRLISASRLQAGLLDLWQRGGSLRHHRGWLRLP